MACNAIRVLPGSGTLLAQWSFAPFSSKPKCSCPCLRATQRCALQRQWHTSKHLGQVFPSTPHHGSDLHLHSLLSSQVGYFDIENSETLNQWPRGPMDKASAYGAGDCRFESHRGHALSLNAVASFRFSTHPNHSCRCLRGLRRCGLQKANGRFPSTNSLSKWVTCLLVRCVHPGVSLLN